MDYATHAIYEGNVFHRRTTPVFHQFRYRISYSFLDLEQLAQAFHRRWLWSCNGPAVAEFRRADHLGDPALPLVDAVRQLVQSEGIECDGPVCLLTQFRYWGFVMNPVSFFFCYSADRRQLRAVVAEVHNTPWGERHCYVLPIDKTPAAKTWFDKHFHVSPFMPMDQQYRWQVAVPGESLRVRIENYSHGERQFSALLNLRRRPWNTAELHRALWLRPFMTQRIFAAIYWQALRLWWKGAPYYPHPGSSDPPALQPTAVEEEQVACGKRG